MQRTLIIDALNAEKAHQEIVICGWGAHADANAKDLFLCGTQRRFLSRQSAMHRG